MFRSCFGSIFGSFSRFSNRFSYRSNFYRGQFRSASVPPQVLVKTPLQRLALELRFYQVLATLRAEKAMTARES